MSRSDLPPELVLRYDRPVPRYTSYPTAPHFHDGVDSTVYERWLAELPPELPLSIYLHVPFCDTLCWFCGCHTRVVREHRPVEAYARLLEREIDLLAARLQGSRRVVRVHFGGGSPTILTPGEIARIGGRLWHHFDRDPLAEMAVEVDPRGLDPAVVEAFAAIGANRASIGVQDVNEAVQRAVNRIQPPEVTAAAVEMLRAAGLRSINLDLMYGLPHQTVERVLETVDSALALAPARVALFGYAHVPHMKRHQQLLPEEALPGVLDRYHQAQAAAQRLVAAGYLRIGLDHFARPDDGLGLALLQGRLHRNFQGYTDDPASALIGLGASAIGALPQGYVQNEVSSPRHREAVLGGRLPTARGIALSEDDRVRRRVIERIMCDLAVDLDAVAPDLDVTEALRNLAPLAADGLVEIAGRRICVPERARPLLRLVAAAFDAYLGQSEARHARAV